MRLLFLIPARGGSKGLPGKNLALLGGVPLLGRAVRVAREAARDLGGESRVVCSTDDPTIAEAARQWGAEVPFIRPAELATDDARTLSVVLHALEALGGTFDVVVLLQPTSPLTLTKDVCDAVRLFRDSGSPVISVCREAHPLEWHHRMDDAGRLTPVLPPRDAYQRQKVEPTYRPNGAVYVASPAQVRGGGFWAPETRGFLMPAERSVDVDTAADLEVARTLLVTRPPRAIEIAGREIGPGLPCLVIAEAGVNHNGSLEVALRLVDAAAEAGADAVKFQTFQANKTATSSAPKAEYQVRTTGADETQFELLKRLELNPEAHKAIAVHCAERRLTFLSTPFDEESADLLETLGVPAFKVASGELTNLCLLRYLARKGRPLIISTGMATLGEVERAVDTVRAEGCHALSLLHCVSNYPADPADSNLRAMSTMAAAFGVPVGYSDHTLGIEVPLAAVALGACIIEKHFTLDRTLAGPDHGASAEPGELASLVAAVRKVEAALGDGEKRPAASEADTARVARRSLVAACPIPAGAVLEPSMVAARRPGTGMAAERGLEILGHRSRVAIAEGTLLALEMFE